MYCFYIDSDCKCKNGLCSIIPYRVASCFVQLEMFKEFVCETLLGDICCICLTESSEYKIVSLLYMGVHKLHMWKIIHGKVIWRIIEVHLHKIAMVVIFVCSVNEVSINIRK